MTEIEFHQKRLPLISDVIEGYIAAEKLINLEMIYHSDNTPLVDNLLDGKKEVKKALRHYQNAFEYSENFLTQKGIDVDYFWLRMTRDEWENYKQWENKFVLSYLKKEHPIIHFFKSLKNKTLWQKRKEIRPPVFIRSTTWLQSQPAQPKK